MAVAGILPLGSSPQKMYLKYESSENNFDKQLSVMFNPSQFTINRSMNWASQPAAHLNDKSQFTHVEAATLDINFFFDTFETGEDVTNYTFQIWDLGSCLPEMHRPPVVQFFWGDADPIFQGVATGMSEAFNLFLKDGTPVRSTLTCHFKEMVPPEEQHSADVSKAHTLRRGDTLSSISALEYGDPAVWRLIASANRIVDPLRLTPGTTLLIPAVKGPLPR